MRVLPTVVSRGIKRTAREAFPARLMKARKAMGISASALSDAACIGQASVALMERGKRLPRIRTVARLAQILGCSPGGLAFGDQAAVGESDAAGLARRVQLAREERGLTYHQLGQLAGTTYAQARALESGTEPDIEMAERFAAALRVRASWLAYGLGDRELPRRGARRPTAAAGLGESSLIRTALV